MAWSISPTTGVDFNTSTGVAKFSANTSNSNSAYTITYTDANGCTASTTYTVSACTGCKSAFTYTEVSGCLDYVFERYTSDNKVLAHTESLVITGVSSNCNGEYSPVTFSCPEYVGPGSLWTASTTHTGTSYTITIYRASGEYNTYAGMPSSIRNEDNKTYSFTLCTNKLVLFARPYIVDKNDLPISQWSSGYKPDAYGVHLSFNVPIDESVSFTFKIDTSDARRTASGYGNCPSIGAKQQYASLSVAISSGQREGYATYPASYVYWEYPCGDNPSGYCQCFPPFEYYDSVSILELYEPSTVETSKYILKINMT